MRELIHEDGMNQGSSGDKLNDEEARVYRSTVAKLNYWAQDRLDLQHTVRICSKFVANPTARDWMRGEAHWKVRGGMSKHRKQ